MHASARRACIILDAQNAIVDVAVIEALYEAGLSGQDQLIVRCACPLQPGASAGRPRMFVSSIHHWRASSTFWIWFSAKAAICSGHRARLTSWTGTLDRARRGGRAGRGNAEKGAELARGDRRDLLRRLRRSWQLCRRDVEADRGSSTPARGRSTASEVLKARALAMHNDEPRRPGPSPHARACPPGPRRARRRTVRLGLSKP